MTDAVKDAGETEATKAAVAEPKAAVGVGAGDGKGAPAAAVPTAKATVTTKVATPAVKPAIAPAAPKPPETIASKESASDPALGTKTAEAGKYKTAEGLTPAALRPRLQPVVVPPPKKREPDLPLELAESFLRTMSKAEIRSVAHDRGYKLPAGGTNTLIRAFLREQAKDETQKPVGA